MTNEEMAEALRKAGWTVQRPIPIPPTSAIERWASNRCSAWQRGACVHGFPGTRFCAGSLDPSKVFWAAKPQCCDDDWPYELIAARKTSARPRP